MQTSFSSVAVAKSTVMQENQDTGKEDGGHIGVPKGARGEKGWSSNQYISSTLYRIVYRIVT